MQQIDENLIYVLWISRSSVGKTAFGASVYRTLQASSLKMRWDKRWIKPAVRVVLIHTYARMGEPQRPYTGGISSEAAYTELSGFAMKLMY